MTKAQTKKNTDDIRALLASHQEHLLIANQEMGEVKADICVIKTDINWMKKDVEAVKGKQDKTLWLALTTAIGVASTLAYMVLNLK